MAEPLYEEPLQEPVDDDVLPDGVDPIKGLQIFEQLDDGNLVDKIDNTEFTVSETMRLLGEADRSMTKWKKSYKKALELAKLIPEAEKKTFPFDGASTVMLPFLFEAMLDFHSRTVPELVWAENVVGIKTYGKNSKDKEDRSARVSTYMNYQVSESIPFWRNEQDKLLLQLPCVGTGYKKTYFDSDTQEVRSDLYQGDEVIFDHNYKTFEEAPNKFIEEKYTRDEVITYIRGNAKWDIDEDTLPAHKDHPENFDFVRAYIWLDLDDDGLREPYEVIIYKEKEQVVACYPVYDEDDITVNDDGEIVKVEMAKIFTQYRFLPDPEGGPMGMGWGIMLSDMFEALNTTVQQLIDAGTLSNLAGNSGLIDAQMSGGSGRGNRQQSGPIEVRMGELTPITTGGKTLRESIIQFPYQGPNQTLYQLTDWLIQQIRGMTNSAMNMDTNSQEAAVMYLARLQQGLKVPNSIVMRVYNSARDEFKKIANLNYKHYSDTKYNRVLDEQQEFSMRADFNPEDCDIRPATDPSQGSDIERQQRASIVLEEAKNQPQEIIVLREAYIRFLEALKEPDLDTLIPEPSGEPDPMEEMMRANMQREAELEERKLVLAEADMERKGIESMMDAQRKAKEFGISLDKSEAEIFEMYTNGFKNLWEINALGNNPIATAKKIEQQLIQKRPGEDLQTPIESANPNSTGPQQ